MNNQILKQPFEGQPKTRLSYDKDGSPQFDVAIKELTPFRAKSADNIATLTSWATLGLAVNEALSMPSADWKVWLASLTLPFVFQPAFKWVTRGLSKKTTRVRFTADEFLVREWPKPKSFERQLDHSFQLLTHDDREKEKEKLQLAAMRARQRGKLI
ncbi:MAG: hypothetical protein JKY34_03020, partial [Kordiimonadaceae bacterium]|nr:hypothetical protein [Kordiimonadaceae bacterium]